MADSFALTLYTMNIHIHDDNDGRSTVMSEDPLSVFGYVDGIAENAFIEYNL